MADLAHVLRSIPLSSDPRILAGSNRADDAAVYRLTDDLALVQTVDFFTPIVDDPYTFGQIAAANSLSDVYAMGGTPLTALNVVGFPVAKLGAGALTQILLGGAEICRQAGVSIVGGHTVEDREPKYGLAVTGTVHPERFMSAHGAVPGDVLVLTKPLGTGVISTALKADAALESHVAQAVRWMLTLNRSASTAMLRVNSHAATDVTGFGLIGHLVDLCRASGVSARIFADRVPLLPSALEYAREGHVPGGSWTNLDHLQSECQVGPKVEDALKLLLFDPQTSGGLLVSMPPDAVTAFRASPGDDFLCAVIGEIQPATTGVVTVSG
jgi:selenide,water dikinase